MLEDWIFKNDFFICCGLMRDMNISFFMASSLARQVSRDKLLRKTSANFSRMTNTISMFFCSFLMAGLRTSSEELSVSLTPPESHGVALLKLTQAK
jgi:hypothetical protein